MKAINCVCLLFLVAVHQMGAVLSSANSIQEDEIDISPATPVASSVTTSSIRPLMRAIEIIEFVSKFSNSESEGFGVTQIHSALEDNDDNELAKEKSLTKTADPLNALSSLAVYGATKILTLFLSAFMYFLSLINPNAFASGPIYSTDGFKQVDYSAITNTIRSIHSRSFQLFDIRETECQNRAMCEIGQSIGGYFPALSRWVRFVEEQFNFKSLYNEALIRGVGLSDCQSTYKQSCPRSPLKKFQQIVTTFTKFY